MQEFASGVMRLPILFVNTYFVDIENGWVLIDSGLPGAAGKIKSAAAARYGSTPPRAIVLTHGHFDHASSARALAEEWSVPIYAHALEIPYLSGQSDYPPHDPTVGGAIAFLSRAMPDKGLNLGEHLRALPDENEGGEIEIAELPGWKIFFTPGHAPGHVSLFREAGRVLLAGDAFATEDMDSWIGIATQKPQLARAGSPYNCDWQATEKSVQRLAALEPAAIGCGHGAPQSGAHLPADLHAFAATFSAPAHGRYIPEPACTNESGVVSVPPPAPDSFPKIALALGAAALGVLLLLRGKAKS